MYPYYLAIGMNEQEFWEKPPIFARCFKLAHRIKMQEDNQKMWISGLYFMKAINAAFGKNCKYPQEPFDLNLIPKSDEEIAEEERKTLLKQYEQLRRIHANKMAEKERKEE